MTLLSIDNNNCKNSQQENTAQWNPDRYDMNTSDQMVDVLIQGIYPGDTENGRMNTISNKSTMQVVIMNT